MTDLAAEVGTFLGGRGTRSLDELNLGMLNLMINQGTYIYPYF